MKEFDENIFFLQGSLFPEIWQIGQVLRSNVSLNVSLMKRILGQIELNESELSKTGTTPVQFKSLNH